MELYVSNLFRGVQNGIEFELVYNFFISCSIAEIPQFEVQHRHIGLWHMISQQSSKIGVGGKSERCLKWGGRGGGSIFPKHLKMGSG